jgi:hypothetical protein
MAKTSNEEILEQLKLLSEKVNNLDDGNDLELNYQVDNKAHSQMLEVDPGQTDSFGDSVELVTKSRLENNAESFKVAVNFVSREYHNMQGNRYGKHSKLIPILDNYGKKTRLDMVWFSGSDIKIVKIDGKEYYKIRLLVYDILIKKLLLARMPTGDGKSRQEEIQHKGAGIGGQGWINQNAPMSPMAPINYKGQQNNNPSVGDTLYEQK